MENGDLGRLFVHPAFGNAGAWWLDESTAEYVQLLGYQLR